MEEFIKNALPYIIAIISAVAYIIYKSKDSIVKIFKNKADEGEAALKAFEEKLEQDRKKDAIKNDAQNFLSDVGRNYFKILAEESENLKTQLMDSEETLQQTILEREEFRIKYNAVNESYQDTKDRLVFSESERIKKDLILQEYEVTISNQRNVIKKMEEDLGVKNESIVDLKQQLDTALREKELAEKRFDEERKQSDMLLEENRRLREGK